MDINNKTLLNLWLCNIDDIGSITIGRLKSKLGSVQAIFEASGRILESIVGENNSRKIIESRISSRIEEMYCRLNERNIRFIYPEHEDYPHKLKQIYDYPQGLYIKGHIDASLNDYNKNIALVGSRMPTTYGREITNHFACNLAMNGFNIISGLARGIDGVAHKGALVGGGYTVAVLGCGINITYPREHFELYDQIEKNGLIISEYGLDVEPIPGRFPRRNRIISGLSDGVCVVEARKKSGSLITMEYALDQGKQIYAVPGRLFDSNSEGTNNVIKMGGMCVCSYEDIIKDMLGTENEYNTIDDIIENKKYTNLYVNEKYSKVAKKVDKNINGNLDVINVDKKLLAPIEKIVYSCLSLEPTYIDDIICKSGQGITKVISTLYILEEKGLIKQPLKGYYIVTI